MKKILCILLLASNCYANPCTETPFNTKKILAELDTMDVQLARAIIADFVHEYECRHNTKNYAQMQVTAWKNLLNKTSITSPQYNSTEEIYLEWLELYNTTK